MSDPTTPGTPQGMSNDDVDRRSEFAAVLGKEIWPADAATLVRRAGENNAPDWVLGQLRSLPSDRDYANASDAWRALHHGVEQHRF